MSQYTGKAPGVEFIIPGEEAIRSEGISNAIGIVGVALKGPLDAVLLSTAQQCISVFGEPHENNSAVKGALACLKNSKEVWFKRVVSANATKGTSWTDETPDGTGVRPWAVFTTKEITQLYNGSAVTLTWTNNGTEDLPVYKINYEFRDARGHILESYRCDEDKNSDLYIGKILGLYSAYLDISIEGEPDTRDQVTYVISSGDSGLDATVDDIIGTGNSGMKAFYDPESISVSTLVVPTWADKRVWEEGIRIGEYRQDLIFIPSLPVGLTPTKVVDLVRGVGEFISTGLQFNKTFVPLYWPNGVLKNPATGALDIVDIAPYIASTYAKSDAVSNIWTAPAGVKRGIVQGLDGLEYKTTKEERDILYSEEINVNSVVSLKGYGITIMGARTSRVFNITEGNTALRYVNIRRLCNYARKVVMNESMRSLFDQNDYYTWNDWKMRIDPYFRSIKEGRGVYDYEIVMDETTITQSDIDSGRMPGMIKIAPIKPNEYITIDFVIAKDGTVTFSEEVEVV